MTHPTALLIIDVQAGFFTDDTLVAQRPALMSELNRLVSYAHQQQWPIWNIRTIHRPDRSTWTLNMQDDDQGFVFNGQPDAENLPELKLPAGVHALTKTRDSAFTRTDLEVQLRAQGVSRLVLAGVSTHSCVFLTAADAYALDFRVTLARDAIATENPQLGKMALHHLQAEYRQDCLSLDELRAKDN